MLIVKRKTILKILSLVVPATCVLLAFPRAASGQDTSASSRITSASGASRLTASSQAPPARPNILIIMADDLGFSDLGCYGGEVETPSLNKLAREGLRYRQFYNAARCCPSRAALMTGLYPHQAGMGWMAAADLGTPEYAGNLNDHAVTIAEVLKTAGYSTYMTGKWHLTNERKIDGRITDNWPVHRGFDRYFGIIPGGANYFTPTVYSHDSAYKAPPDFYLTDAISDTSVTYLDEHFRQATGKPFFMYVAYTAPHWPLHALKEEIERYRERYLQGWDAIREKRFRRQQEMGLFPENIAMNRRDPAVPAWEGLSTQKKEEMAMRMAIYAAQIDIMDQGIGRIIDELRANGQLDNTLVFFLSDNGACAEFISSGKSKAVDGTRNTFESYRINWANVGSTPFKEYKHYTHEGGIAAPLIVHWPKGIREDLNNTFVSQYGHITDLMATCVEVSGAKYPLEYRGSAIHPLAGKSLVPHFSGESNHRGRIFWEHEANIALRDGKWKLVAKTLQDEEFDPGSLELYDMEADPVEMHNLASEKPGLVKEMYAQWLEWAKKIKVFPLDTRGYGARMQAYRRSVNGGFDDNLGGWNVREGRFLVSVDTTGKLSGKRSARISVSPSGASGDAGMANPVKERVGANAQGKANLRGKAGQPEPVLLMAWPFPAKKGESFSLSFLAASEERSSLRVRLEKTGKDGVRPIDGQVWVEGKGEFRYRTGGLPEEGTYRIAFYRTLPPKPAAAGSKARLDNSAGTIWIDDVTLTPLRDSSTATTRQPNRDHHGSPNIVIILADDLGWGDVGFHGSEIKTPHLDSLARAGIILDRFYTAPICSPTRAGLLTGRYPDRLGLRETVIPPWSEFGVDTAEVFLPELLRDAGYLHRAAIGKWHLGHSRRMFLPLQRGFTHFYGHYNGAIDYFTHEREGELDWHNDEKSSDDHGYSTDLITDEAVKCIGAYAGENDPFFLYVAYNAPHGPLQAKEEDLSLYGNDDSAAVSGQNPETASRRRTYSAMVTCMDRGIGRMMAALRKAGVAENTIVLFFSDNGAAPRGGGSSGKLRGTKFQEWDGGVRSPALISWPSGFPGERTVRQVTGYIDVLPTLLEAAGAKSHAGRRPDGISILPVLTGEAAGIDRSFYLGYGSIIAGNKWKLVKAGAGNPRMKLKEDALYDILKDPSERNNLKDQYPDVYERLKNLVTPLDAIEPVRQVKPYGYGREDFKAPKDWKITE